MDNCSGCYITAPDIDVATYRIVVYYGDADATAASRSRATYMPSNWMGNFISIATAVGTLQNA